MAIGDKAAKKVLETVSDTLWDLKANLMTDIVDQHGPGRSLAWFARNMPKYEKILKAWGPLRTHYLASVISATNGCAYCTYGHGYAFNLHYFDVHDRLFPVSEGEMRDANALSAEEVISLFTAGLVDAEMEDEVEWVNRTTEMMETKTAETTDDERILHLITMFAWLNSCGINADTEPDEAHDPINKNTELRARYEQARAPA